MNFRARRATGGFAAGLLIAIAALLPLRAAAQAIDGAAAIVVIPVVVSSGSFATRISVYNPSPYGLTATVQVTFYGAPGTPIPGATVCTGLSILPGQTVEFDFQAQCSLPAPGGSRFGSLRLYSDPTGVGVVPIIAYSRVSNPQGNGFSVEAFPAGTFEGAAQNVIGLKRQAATPTFQTNCFISALGEAVPGYTIKLRTASGALLGNTINGGALAAYAMVRYVDIFAAAGLPTGDFTGARAEFVNTDATANGPGQAIVAFCTVQDNTSFGADFRIAKAMDPRDESRRRYAAVGGYSIPDATTKHRFLVQMRAPDVVQCLLLPGPADFRDQLEMRMAIYGGALLPGGGLNNDNVISPDLGQKGTYPQYAGLYGRAGLYYIEVGPREGLVNPPAFPWTYGIECNAGGGTTTPFFYESLTDNF
jgi:hypothetical protein